MAPAAQFWMWSDVSADPWLVLGAATIEAVVGYPDCLHRRAPHPVVWMGGLIAWCDKTWNREDGSPKMRRVLGVATLVMIITVAGVAGWLPSLTPRPVALGLVLLAGTLGLAQRSLFDHVRAVAKPLALGDISAARLAVGAIVGRDVTELDEQGVAAAALESLAESFNDGVVAPIFWFVVGGLPGLFIYKAVNTADSLIGHREPRWRDFGWASARMDDLMNLIPSRIAGCLIALAGRGGWRVMARDAGEHASPNSGWPEAAMAGALKVQLGGSASYDGVIAERAKFGAGLRPRARDLEHGLCVYVTACGFAWLLLALGGLAWPR
jgi:adenosylcobinamide-phosphate synthase